MIRLAVVHFTKNVATQNSVSIQIESMLRDAFIELTLKKERYFMVEIGMLTRAYYL